MPIVTWTWRALLLFRSTKNFTTCKKVKVNNESFLEFIALSINNNTYCKFQEMEWRHTTAVDDIDRKEPTKTPSDNAKQMSNKMKYSLHNCTEDHISQSQHHTMARIPQRNMKITIWSNPPRTATGPTAFNWMGKNSKTDSQKYP